jgi:hypothetical protein
MKNDYNSNGMCEDAPCCGCCGSNGMEVLGSEDFHALENEKHDAAMFAGAEDDGSERDNDEPHGSYDFSDDGDALASAGFGTDEDYGGWGGDDY